MATLPTPLTTTFTPAPSCLRDIHWDSASPWYVLGAYNADCLPPGPKPDLSSYYSPGLYCPSGFTVACSSSTSVGSDIETRAVCCPSLNPQQFGTGFQCTTGPSWGAWSSYGCAMGFSGFATQGTPLTIVVGGTTTSTMLAPTDVNGGVNAFSVQLRWRDKDLSLLSTVTSSTSSVRETVSTTTAATSTSSVQAGTKGIDKTDGGMSAGAKIAIGVVVPLVLLIIAAVVFVVWRRKGRSNVVKQHVLPPVQAMSQEKYEVHGSSVKLASTVRQEIADTSSDWSRAQERSPATRY